MDTTGVGEHLRLGDHICVLTENADDRFAAMVEVVDAGLRGRDLVIVVTHSLSAAIVEDRLQSRGAPVRAGLRSGQVRVLSAREIYLPTGQFEAAELCTSMAGLVGQTLADGYPGLRLIADMTWTVDAPRGTPQLAGYEAAVNRLVLDAKAFGACLYDRHDDAGLLRAVSCAHPATAKHLGPGWEPLLRLRRTHRPYGLAIVGEVDASNRQALCAALDAVADELPDRTHPIVLDLSRLRFGDAATGGALGKLAERAPAGIRLLGYHGSVAIVIEQLGLAHLPGVELLPAATRTHGGGTDVRGPVR